MLEFYMINPKKLESNLDLRLENGYFKLGNSDHHP